MQPVSWRLEAGVYASALFGATQSNLVAVIVPLWLLHLHASPVMIGIALGAFHALPFAFSVHGGALMDRLGTRTVLVVFALASLPLPFLYPLLPFVWAILVLQMIIGTTSTMAWVGAQAMIGQAMGGSPVYAGRLAFVSVIGNLVGPPMAGAAWDYGGPWAAFSVLGLWCACQFAAAMIMPRELGGGAGAEASPAPGASQRFSLRDLVPEVRSYADAFTLAALPMVAFILAISMLRIGGHAIQGSFYVVYLKGTGLTGTAIGTLFATGAVAAGIGALAAAPLTRRFGGGIWLMFLTSGLSVAAIAVTPLLGLYVFYIGAQAVRGIAVGISTPLIITEMSAVVGPAQGKAVGLRTMTNRFMSTVTPMAVGAIVAVVGLEASFLVAGLLLLVLMVGAGVYARVRKIL